MTSDTGWVIYSDESSYNYGAVRGVGAVSLRVDDSARLGEELASLLRASSVRELKWEKVRTARAAFAAQKALTWALDHALDGELWIETLTWEVTSAAASRARRPALTQLRNAYTTLLSSAMARHARTRRAIAGLANRPRRAVRHPLDAYTRGFATDRHHHARTLRAAATYPASRCLRGIGDLFARSLRRLRALALRSRSRPRCTCHDYHRRRVRIAGVPLRPARRVLYSMRASPAWDQPADAPRPLYLACRRANPVPLPDLRD